MCVYFFHHLIGVVIVHHKCNFCVCLLYIHAVENNNRITKGKNQQRIAKRDIIARYGQMVYPGEKNSVC